MKRNLYSVYDHKAELYGTPFALITNGEAVRAFKRLVEDKNTMPGQYPGDFQLVHLGTFDDSTGKLEGFERPTSLGYGTDYVVKVEPIPLKTVKE